MNRASVARLLLISPSLSGGGAERVIVWLADQWSQIGTHVTLVTIAGDSQDAYAVPDAVNRITLNMDEVSTNPFAGVIANLKRIYKLRQCIRACDPDLIISFQTTANINTVLATRGIRCPVVISERNYTPLIPLGASWIRIRNLTYRWADEVVSQTVDGADWLKTHGRCRSVSVIPNVVQHPLPIQSPEQRPDTFVEPDVPIVLAAGRISHAKGFDILVQAFAIVIKQYPMWKLVILGGDDSSKLEVKIAAHGLQEHVLMVGRVGNPSDWYKRAQLFVLSSRREGFPNVLVEAMSYGLPVVSTDCLTGPRDIITPDKDGLLVPVDDPERLADAMGLLMGDENLRKRLSDSATAVTHRYGSNTVFARWLDLAVRVCR